MPLCILPFFQFSFIFFAGLCSIKTANIVSSTFFWFSLGIINSATPALPIFCQSLYQVTNQLNDNCKSYIKSILLKQGSFYLHSESKIQQSFRVNNFQIVMKIRCSLLDLSYTLKDSKYSKGAIHSPNF